MKRAKVASGATRKARRLTLECLECRALLAGNVSASQSGSTLFIRGDNAGNEIGITEVGDDTYLVAGVGTTVNGAAERTFSGIRNINVDLRGGNDILGVADDFTGLDVAIGVIAEDEPADLTGIETTDLTGLDGTLIIQMGTGNDLVGLTVDVGGSVIVNTSSGADRVDVASSEVNGDLIINTQDGADSVTVLDSFVNASIVVNTGRHVDGVLVQQSDAGGIVVNGGRERDQVGVFDVLSENHIIVIGDTGNDDLEVEFTESRYLQINGGSGNDEIDADGNDVFGTLHAIGGSGNDFIEVEPNDDFVDLAGTPVIDVGDAIAFVEGALIIDGGAGNDDLEAELAEANSITIIGGAGNDFLDADGVLTENHVVIIGGAGNDSANVGLSDDADFTPGVPSEIGSFLHVILGAGNDDAAIFEISVDGHILVDAGSGNDEVVFELVEATDWILALMGSGNTDVLAYSDVTAGGDETLDGGPGGDDTLIIDSTTGRRIRNFENVVV
jgi:hypothetical protein